MKILSVSIANHDSCLTILTNGKITDHYLAERITKRKREREIQDIFSNIINENKNNYYDLLVLNIFDKKCLQNLLQIESIKKTILCNNEKFKKIVIREHDHHISHAYCGFYTSSFDTALCFVFDGSGSSYGNGNLEIESVFLFKNKKISKTIYKKYWNSNTPISYKNFFDNENMSIGLKYQILAQLMGFNHHSAGKVMGLGQYKGHESKLEDPYNSNVWKNRVNDAYNLQIHSQNRISTLIKKYSEKTGIKNIILTGGVALNCACNNYLIKKFPELNFHVDPICSDKGISIGSSLYNYIKYSKEIPDRINNVYFGAKENNIILNHALPIKKTIYRKFSFKKVNYDDVIELILNKNVVALFQGKSESGERSLGNRSLLFDPRVVNGKTIVNIIKRRENFRPFAASILLEETEKWFDLGNLKESPYMSYALDAYENSIKNVPAVIHANNTSRIQTVTKKQNFHLYNLIFNFFKKTNVPMLLNTSFNLANQPIVETLDDAICTLLGSDIENLYLPEIDTLITIKN